MLSILISSTFNDMQAERDVIRSRVAPVLRRIAAQYGQSVRLIDLRWGVNTADMSEEAAAQKVLETCLKEIDRCEGYMICLLGNRYGWVPDYTNLTTVQDHGIHMPHPVSVTELEIQYGILQRNAGEKSVIFLRDEVTDLPSGLHGQYNDPADDRRMAQLKSRLEALPQGTVEHYSLKYVADGEFSGINSFAERLIERASELLHRVLGSECKLDETEVLKRKFHNIIEEHCEAYLPDPRLEQEISSFAAGSSSVLMLQGEEGSGRTALICRLSQSPPPGVRVIPYFCSEQCTGRTILSYFTDQLNRDGERTSGAVLSSQSALEEYFSELLSHLEAPVWFAVDGLNLLGGDEHSRLSWLPHHLPSNVRFVFTSVKHDSACNQLGESFYVQYCDMPPMPDPAQFLRAGLAAAGKAVPDTVLSQVARHPLSSNYLFCDMVVRMLMLMDRHDFAVMNRDGGGIDAINAYILSKIDDLPETMAEMAFLFLYDCGEQITPGNTAPFLSAIAQAPMGLRAQDLQGLFPEDWDEADFSYFTAFLDGFLVCDDNGCYTFPSGLMQSACLRVGESDLLMKLAVYFATLPDNDPVKAGSALPMFLIYRMYDQAGALLLTNPHLKVLYVQLWNMLAHTRAGVSALLCRDDVLELFLANGMELCEDTVRLAIMSDLLRSRTPPEDTRLHRRMLLALAQLQLRCKDKRGAYQTLATLLPLEDAPLARAKTIVMMTECSFVDQAEQISEIKKLLDEALDIFSAEVLLSRYDSLLMYKGQFYRYLFSLQDAIGISIHGAWSYADFTDKQKSSHSSLSYVDTLVMLRLSSLSGSKIGPDVFRVLIQMCSLGEMIQTQICADNELNTPYAQLFLSLLKVMGNMDSPAEPFAGALPPKGARLLAEFRVLRSSLIHMAHGAAQNALHGRYDAPMLKILAHLQIHLAYISDEAAQRRALLEQSTRILWRYFSVDPLSDFSEELANGFLALADCCLDPEDRAAYDDALEKWGSVALAMSRHAIGAAKEQCLRYPDEIHGKALAQARHRLTGTWTEYAERLWLRELYRFKSNIDLMLSLYRSNIRRGIRMSPPTDVVNLRAALVLVKKITELEPCFDDTSLSDLYQKTLSAAFHALLVTTLEVILLSEQTVAEGSDDVLSTPQFYYPKTAAFVESYIRRCKERDLDIASETVLRLSFCMAQLKLKSALYCQDSSESQLWEVLVLLDTLTDRLPPSPIPSDWLFDEVSVDAVRQLQCRAYLLLGDISDSRGDAEGAAVCYRQVCTLCAALHTGNTAQTTAASRYLSHALPPLLAYYEQLGAEDEYSALWELLDPLFSE